MKKRAKLPPSKIRYDRDHPIVSVRVTKKLRDELREMKDLSGKSIGDILREALKKQTPSVKESYNYGYQAAKGEYAVYYKCSKCGGNLVVSTDHEKQDIAKYMRECGWAHGDCL